MIVGGDETLLDGSVRLARSAGMAGVNVTRYIGAEILRFLDEHLA